jgi:hypothetical protein
MIKYIVFLAIAVIAISIPFNDQVALANSLIVGNDNYDDLYNWSCKVCDSTNKPIHAHPI